MKIELQWVGGKSATRSRIRRIPRLFARGGRRARQEVARAVRKEALPLTPIDTGALRRSAKVTSTRDSTTVSYGDDDVYYAVYVHEGLPRSAAGKSSYHAPPTTMKFLEIAVGLVMPRIPETYRQYIVHELRKGATL